MQSDPTGGGAKMFNSIYARYLTLITTAVLMVPVGIDN